MVPIGASPDPVRLKFFFEETVVLSGVLSSSKPLPNNNEVTTIMFFMNYPLPSVL
jgi:hypothetical protein